MDCRCTRSCIGEFICECATAFATALKNKLFLFYRDAGVFFMGNITFQSNIKAHFYLCLAALIWSTTPVHAATTLLQLPAVEVTPTRLSALPSIFVQDFILQGNRVFSTAELQQAVLNAYHGRYISAAELQEIRHKLSQYYYDKGYINSGALIPDQDVQDGIVRIDIIEGRLSAIQLSGNQALRSSWLLPRLRPHADEPLNSLVLQERLQILQQNPLIQRFDAELGPGVRPDEAILNFHLVEQKRPYQFSAEFNNHRSPSIGAYRLVLDAKHQSLSGRNDELYARYGITEGLNDYHLSYSLPVTARDTRLEVRLERSDAKVVAKPFVALNVESQTDTYSLGVKHPLIQRYTSDFHYQMLEAGISLDKRSSKTYLLEQPFSFSAGVQDGESKVTAVRLNQNWLDRSQNRVLFLSSSFGLGLNIWDATQNDVADINGNMLPDGEFITWIGQIRWIERFPSVFNEWIKNSQLVMRADAQWSNDDLLPLEKFTFGGASSVRGYRENQLVYDHALVVSLEWQIPLNTNNTVFLAPFIDYGWGSNYRLEVDSPSSIASVGLGVLWNPYPFLNTQLYWGHALRDMADTQENDIQDKGVHFSIRAVF
jgi:hemolysin activation/secretion protein